MVAIIKLGNETINNLKGALSKHPIKRDLNKLKKQLKIYLKSLSNKLDRNGEGKDQDITHQTKQN